MAVTTLYTGTSTIGGTEYSLTADSTSLGAIANPGIYELWLDTNAIVIADEFQLKIYEKVLSGGTQRVVWESTLPVKPCVVLPRLMLMHGWEMSIKKIAGTDRSIPWDIRKVGSCAEVYSVTRTNTTTRWSITANADASSAPATQTSAGIYQVFIDQSTLAADDIHDFRIYEKVSTTQRIAYEAPLLGGKVTPIWPSPALSLSDGFDGTIEKLAGANASLVCSMRKAA